jgi:hypothetical protein
VYSGELLQVRALSLTVRILEPMLGGTQKREKEGIAMAQRLHLVFGGELEDPQKTVFRDTNDLHIVGIFPSYDEAYAAWKDNAQRTVDNAHMRYFIAHLHRLRDEEQEAGPTEELD